MTFVAGPDEERRYPHGPAWRTMITAGRASWPIPVHDFEETQMRSIGTSTHPAATPTRGRYRVDPNRSVVRFRTRHLFGLGGVTGAVQLRAAEIVVGDTMLDTSVRAVLDANSFDTGNAMRDRSVRSSTYLDSSRYPDIDFAADNLRLENGTWVASGTLTAHGVTAPVDVTVVAVEETGTELSVRATATVDRYAHGITAGKGLAGRTLELDMTAVAVRR
jgi:polyisoprenoid-binding protein YceI